ncbi:TPA: hypothetical protein ACTNQZ_004058, partial [Salmonella enterica subsp. enterica serovar Enteritidis]
YSIALCSCLFPSATVITLCRYNKIAPKETLSVTGRATIDIQPVISRWEIKTSLNSVMLLMNKTSVLPRDSIKITPLKEII